MCIKTKTKPILKKAKERTNWAHLVRQSSQKQDREQNSKDLYIIYTNTSKTKLSIPRRTNTKAENPQEPKKKKNFWNLSATSS